MRERGCLSTDTQHVLRSVPGSSDPNPAAPIPAMAERPPPFSSVIEFPSRFVARPASRGRKSAYPRDHASDWRWRS